MFLHTILYMIILQTTFLHVYHLKDDIRFPLMATRTATFMLVLFRGGPVSGFSLHVDRISSVVLRGVSHEGRLIGRGARNQEQEGNRDTRVRQVWAISTI